MKLLVDECLSEELTKFGQRRGHAEVSPVSELGHLKAADWGGQMRTRRPPEKESNWRCLVRHQATISEVLEVFRRGVTAHEGN